MAYTENRAMYEQALGRAHKAVYQAAFFADLMCDNFAHENLQQLGLELREFLEMSLKDSKRKPTPGQLRLVP